MSLPLILSATENVAKTLGDTGSSLQFGVLIATLILLILTVCLLLYTVKLYGLSKVETSCLKKATKINLSKKDLQINVRNESHTTKAMLRANLFVNGEKLK